MDAGLTRTTSSSGHLIQEALRPRHQRLLGTKDCTALDELKDPDLRAKHLALIGASEAKIILVCGIRAANIVRDALGASRQDDLELRGFKYGLYVMDCGPLVKRLFVRCPEIPADSRS